MAASTSTAASPNASASAKTPTAASPNTNYNFHYDIFINHSGSDVKYNFASHLYRLLRDRGFRVFWNRHETQAGDSLNSQIQGAIATASVHIAIFSPTYAESESCLNELLLMLKSKATVVPVFYHVKPSDLQIRTSKDGVYAKALVIHEKKKRCDSQTLIRTSKDGVYAKTLVIHEKKKRCDSQTLAKWRTALFDVSQLGGLELEAYNGDEGELLDRVVKRLEEEVTKPQFSVGKHPTGLDEKLQDFEKKVLLQQQQHRGEVKLVGIVGSGGVGKTTLAREFFNRKRSGYGRSCFLSDVGEAAGRSSLHSLQNKLIKELTSLDPEIVSVAEGKGKFAGYLSSTRALIILDDVQHVDLMDAIYLPLKDVLPSGSLIVVTSRDKELLRKSGMPESSILHDDRP